MATKKTSEAPEGTGEQTGALSREAELTAALNEVKTQLANQESLYQHEVGRLKGIIERLQHESKSVHPDATPQGALSYIITYLEAVAVGGSAGYLRSAVHVAAGRLNTDDRMKLREYVQRLASATDAVVQESATFFV